MKKPELLAPAGSLENLKTAVDYGADAVYIGGVSYGLRAKAKNFSPEEMAQGIAFAHGKGARVYVTLNIIAHSGDLDGIRAYLEELSIIKPDALIISDPGVFMLARRICPDIDIHISTQANNTNYETFRFWHGMGAKRVVTARELSLAEILQIRENIPDELEIETFVHGAMCISYSGRCLLSSYMTGRSANLGECTHPCRWKYAVEEETRPGQYFPVFEDEDGTYIFSSKDLCMIDHIDDLVKAGIDSFKIEGRMKTALYAAGVTRAYRRAIDDFFESEKLYRENIPWYLDEISACEVRPFSTGFFYGRPDGQAQYYQGTDFKREYVYLGTAGDEKDGGFCLKQKNKFSVGETVQIMKPDGRNIDATVLGITGPDGTPQESAPHAGQDLTVLLSELPKKGDVLRRRVPAAGD